MTTQETPEGIHHLNSLIIWTHYSPMLFSFTPQLCCEKKANSCGIRGSFLHPLMCIFWVVFILLFSTVNPPPDGHIMKTHLFFWQHLNRVTTLEHDSVKKMRKYRPITSVHATNVQNVKKHFKTGKNHNICITKLGVILTLRNRSVMRPMQWHNA